MEKNYQKSKSILSLFQKRRRGKFFYFMSSLVLLLVLYPYFEGSVIGKSFLSLLILAVLTSGVYAVSENKRHFIIAFLLGFPWLIGNWVTLFLSRQSPDFIQQSTGLESLIFGILFLIYTTIITLNHVLKDEEVTSDTLYGAICVYILIGLTWGGFYLIINVLQPGSFYIDASQNIDNVINGADLIFHSYVTLTTLGYGDITPVTSHARSLAFLEAIVGQLYLAILVARLVGLYLSKSIKQES